ncbi:MAG: phage holin family protein [Jatrophihabitans sp.]
MTVTPQPTGVTPRPAPAPMPAHAAPVPAHAAAKEPSLGELVSDASTHLSTIIHGEIELAKLELKLSLKNAGVGIGLFLGAAVVLVFSLTFGFIALAEGIAALGLSRWLAFLIVFAFLLILVALFVVVGYKKVKKVKAPQKTIRTTKETVDYLKKSRH